VGEHIRVQAAIGTFDFVRRHPCVRSRLMVLRANCLKLI
jgi:hypothetical protein